MARPGRPKRERTRARGGAGRRQAAKGEVNAAAASAAEEAGGGGGEEKEGRKGAAEEATHRPCRPASPAWRRGRGRSPRGVAARPHWRAGAMKQASACAPRCGERAAIRHCSRLRPAGDAWLYESSPVDIWGQMSG